MLASAYLLLRRVPIVVEKQSAEPFAACDRALAGTDFILRIEQPIAQALMVPLVVIVFKELADCVVQRPFPEEDHAVQAGLFDRPYEALGESV